MADRKKCSTFGVWLQTDLDSAAQNLMETIIKVYICLKTRSREISIDRCSDYWLYDRKEHNTCNFHSLSVVGELLGKEEKSLDSFCGFREGF